MKTETPSNGIRIIGGKWRSRLIKVPDSAAVRPTPNRIRETLFNWLMPHTLDAYCLDAFAGSGALGFEALSRGAKQVTFIDCDPHVIAQLKKTAEHLNANNAEFICAKFTHDIPRKNPFNIVFLDPPFRKNLIPSCLEILNQHNILAPNALIYVEAEKEFGELLLPNGWSLQKQKIAGDVAYHLIRKN